MDQSEDDEILQILNSLTSKQRIIRWGRKKNIKWKIDGDGVLSITGAGEMQDYGYQKAKLAPWCKSGKNTTIKSVVIFDGVESIGDYAFYNCENVNP